MKLLRKYKMFVIGHTSWWAELGSNYEPVRKAWVEHGKRCIRVSSELGISLLNFHSHSRGMYNKEKAKKQILNNSIKSLKELIKYGKKYNIKIMLENAAENGEITDLKDFKHIIDRVPGLKVHLDVGHAFLFGGMKNIENFIKVFKNKLVHIHVSDNHGESDEHLPIGKGSINYSRVVKLLKKIKYDKTITFEIFTKNRNSAKYSMKKFKKLWK